MLSRMKENPSPRAVGSPGPVNARAPFPSRMADKKLSVRAQGVFWMACSSSAAATAYVYNGWSSSAAS